MRFNSHSDERACGLRVPGALSDKYADAGGIMCLRVAEHPGACEATMCDAGAADGVHWCCRTNLAGPHAEWCESIGP